MHDDLVTALAAALERDHPTVTTGTDYIWTAPPPIQIIDCVLSLSRKYNVMVRPRVRAFANRFPEVTHCKHLNDLIGGYPSPAAFLDDTLNYKYPAKAESLAGVVSYVIGVQQNYPGASEVERLRSWAVASPARAYKSVGVRGFGIAGFQYLRMLFGAETVKPDIHIIAYVSEKVGRSVSKVKAIQLLEEAGAQLGLSIRWLDVAIWETRARPEANSSGAVGVKRRPGCSSTGHPA